MSATNSNGNANSAANANGPGNANGPANGQGHSGANGHRTGHDEAVIVLDTGIIGELMTITGTSAADLLPGLIETYRRESVTLLANLGKAVAGDDRDAIERAAHSLKGNSAILGSVRLAGLCDQLESGAVQGLAAQALVGEAGDAVSEFIGALESLALGARDIGTGGPRDIGAGGPRDIGAG